MTEFAAAASTSTTSETVTTTTVPPNAMALPVVPTTTPAVLAHANTPPEPTTTTTRRVTPTRQPQPQWVTVYQQTASGDAQSATFTLTASPDSTPGSSVSRGRIRYSTPPGATDTAPPGTVYEDGIRYQMYDAATGRKMADHGTFFSDDSCLRSTDGCAATFEVPPGDYYVKTTTVYSAWTLTVEQES